MLKKIDRSPDEYTGEKNCFLGFLIFSVDQSRLVLQEYQEEMNAMKGLVKEYLSKNAARSVNLESLFEFMK